MVHLVNALITILDNFTIKKSRKYFRETKLSIKIPIVFKKTHFEVLEKYSEVLKKLKKINLCKKNFSCVRKSYDLQASRRQRNSYS